VALDVMPSALTARLPWARLFTVAAVAMAGVLAGPAVLLPVAAHAASTAGYCPDANGVTVVVDFTALGGGVAVQCAPGPQSSNLGALQNAGFTVVATNGFLCTINGQPAVGPLACSFTNRGAWGSWDASNGGGWAAGSQPQTGGFAGFTYTAGGNAALPGVAPVRPAAPPPPAPAPPPPAPATTTHRSGTKTPPASRRAASRASRPAASPAVTGTVPAATMPPLAGAVTSSAPGAAQAVRRVTPAVRMTASGPNPGGSPLGAGIGAVVVTVLSAAAAVAVWRQRSRGADAGA
jgi:hypothetical protein